MSITIAPLAILVAILLTILHRTQRDRVGRSRMILWLALTSGGFVSVGDQTGDVHLGVSQKLQVVLLAGLGLLGLVTSRPLRNDMTRATKALCVYGMILFASTIWSVSASVTLLKAIEWNIRLVLVVALVRRYQDRRSALLGLWAYSSSVVLSSLIGLAVFGRRALLLVSGTYRLRGVAPSTHPNTLAIVAVVAMFTSLYYLSIDEISPTIRSRVRLVAVLSLVVAGLTRSRLSFVIGIGLVGIVLMLRSKPKLRPAFLGLVGLLTVVIIQVQNRLVSLLTRGQNADQLTTLTGRTNYWVPGFRYARENIFLGHGFFAGHRIGLMERLPAGLAIVSNIDNMWLENLINVGILGTIPIIVAVTAGTRVVYDSIRSGQETFARYVPQVGLIAFLLLASVYNPSINTLGFAGLSLAFVLMLPAGRVRVFDSPETGPATALGVGPRPSGAATALRS